MHGAFPRRVSRSTSLMKRFVASLVAGMGLAASLVHAEEREPSETWRRFDGTIGKDLGITLYLSENSDFDGGAELSGSYHYHRSGLPIELQIERVEQSEKLKVSEAKWDAANATDIVTGLWDVTLKDQAIDGTWKSPDGKKSLPLHLTESYPKGSVPLRITRLHVEHTMQRDTQRTGYDRTLSYPQVVRKGKVVERLNETLRQHVLSFFSDDDGKHRKKHASATNADIERHMFAPPDEAVEFDGDFNFVDSSSHEAHIVTNGDGFLTVEFEHYSYSGGAHGNFGSDYLVLDLTTGDPVELESQVVKGYQKHWVELGAAALRKDAGVGPKAPLTDAGLFEDKLELNQNWYLVPGGIGYSYNPYEIGPYAAGQISFELEWKDIATDLKPGSALAEFANRFSKKAPAKP